MADAESEEKELDVEIAGQKARVKGYRLADLALPVMAGAMIWGATVMYNHNAEAQNDKSALAAAAKEANKNIVDALRESNSNTLQAIKELTAEQRRSTAAMKEVACLNDPAMKNRGDAREFCKRMSRDDR